MSANPADLCTLADLKAWLNIGSTTDDVLLQRLLTAASVFMQSWMSATIPSASYTEVRDGTGSDTLVLGNTPVTAVTSVTVNGLVQTLSPDGIQPGYLFSDSAIFLVGTHFPIGRRNVTVAYTAGYNPIPFDLAQECISLAAWKYREKSRIGQTGTGMGPEHISFSLKDMPDSTLTLMQQYKKVVPV